MLVSAYKQNLGYFNSPVGCPRVSQFNALLTAAIGTVLWPNLLTLTLSPAYNMEAVSIQTSQPGLSRASSRRTASDLPTSGASIMVADMQSSRRGLTVTSSECEGDPRGSVQCLCRDPELHRKFGNNSYDTLLQTLLLKQHIVLLSKTA